MFDITRLRIYVAGAYSASDVLTAFANMRKSMQVANMLMTLGHAPFCPHLDYHYALISEHTLQDFYDYSMAWLEASDCVVCLPGWEQSKGCRAEVARATELGIPVYDLDEFMLRYHPGLDYEV